MGECTRDRDCNRRTLYRFESDQVCRSHITDPERDRVRATIRAAKDVTTMSARRSGYVEWPYGPNIDIPARERMIEWAREEGVRYRPGTPARWYGVEIPGVALDHVSFWYTGEGHGAGSRYLLVSQPYPNGRPAPGGVVRRNGLIIETNLHPGWYGHGTDFIVIREIGR